MRCLIFTSPILTDLIDNVNNFLSINLDLINENSLKKDMPNNMFRNSE